MFSLPLPFLLHSKHSALKANASRRRGSRPLFFLAEHQPYVSFLELPVSPIKFIRPSLLAPRAPLPGRFMGRWTCTGVVALIILLSAASHGRELPVKKSGQSFVYNHTLAKTLVEYASAVYMTDLTALYTWTCSRCNDLTQGFEMRSLIVDVENCLQVPFSPQFEFSYHEFSATSYCSLYHT